MYSLVGWSQSPITGWYLVPEDSRLEVWVCSEHPCGKLEFTVNGNK